MQDASIPLHNRGMDGQVSRGGKMFWAAGRGRKDQRSYFIPLDISVPPAFAPRPPVGGGSSNPLQLSSGMFPPCLPSTRGQRHTRTPHRPCLPTEIPPMRTTTCLLLAIVTLLFPACDKAADTVELQRMETQCADPWDFEEPYPFTGPDRTLKAYLTRRGVRVLGVRYEVDPVATCEACNCGTGRTIFVTVPESDAGLLGGLGGRGDC